MKSVNTTFHWRESITFGDTICRLKGSLITCQFQGHKGRNKPVILLIKKRKLNLHVPTGYTYIELNRRSVRLNTYFTYRADIEVDCVKHVIVKVEGLGFKSFSLNICLFLPKKKKEDRIVPKNAPRHILYHRHSFPFFFKFISN